MAYLHAFSIESRLFFFLTLPFGLSTVPWVFTKLLKFPLATLRAQGINTIAYLDDWIVWNQTADLLRQDVHTVTTHLQHLGFMVNQQKSVLTPTQSLQWLGITWDTTSFRVSLPAAFQEKFATLASSILKHRSASRRQWERLTGLAAFVV